MPSTIKPQDFSQRVTDVNRYRWTLGKIEHVVAVLKGSRVLVETDARTGHTIEGVIVGYASSGSSNPGARLKIETGPFENGRTQVTNYYLPEVGVIVDLTPFGKAKWDALDRERRAKRIALDMARAQVAEKGEDPWEGSWEIEGYGFGRYYVRRTLKGERSYEGFRTEVHVPDEALEPATV